MIDIKNTVKSLQSITGVDRGGEPVLSDPECIEIIKLIYNIGVNDCCDAVLETSLPGFHNHIERLLIG